ncbi:helix-turn-helix transcriptional regulator (plasmid) [Chromobacterium amazonense]|uniref:helix-turn-helix transcriptional regulator n=1 Tax=Chromobacterium amazonense TaxID=1382803 RepID=UPI00237E6C2B|nr:helix-turn-helix transcriptional regulator [Chromobacterium amazonense]MDE1714910.1 helix-turn-helix transcriptional regulator [Chromobacterium amazonense]
MENTLGSRIRKALDILGEKSGTKKSPNWLANQVGVSRPAAYKWMNNPAAGIDGKNLYKAALVLQVSTDWLASGKGEMLPETRADACIASIGMDDSHIPTVLLPNIKDKQAILDSFAKRVNIVCDRMSIPPAGKNRQAELGFRFGVTQKAARKWLVGEGFPDTAITIQMAMDAKVSYDWLMTGRGSIEATELSVRTWQERARQVMRAKKLTQQAVAEHMHRSQSTFACWLNGRNLPNLEDMDALAKALDVDTAWLVYGIETREDPVITRIMDMIRELPEDQAKKLADVLEALKGTAKPSAAHGL